MQNTEIVQQQFIESKIFLVRGKKVMMDKDLALLYGVTTKKLNQAVKRNIERFSEDFMFRLTKEETLGLLRSQFVTLKEVNITNTYHMFSQKMGSLCSRVF